MQLILLQNVQNLGKLGDKVDVAPGYGRNYLVPHGKAVPATAKSLADFETRRADYEAKAQATVDTAEARKSSLEGVEVTLTANAAAEGKLYGSISPRDIADALTKIGHKVEKSEVVLSEGPLRRTGEYDILIKLHADTEATVKVIVVGEAA